MTDETNKVTEHKTVAEDLQASEIRYRRLFESARDGILILDAVSRKIIDMNPFMVEFLGYSRAEFLDKELWEIGLFKDKDESQSAFRELQEKGYIRYENMPLQTKAGKLWNVEFISNVYPVDGHHVIQCNIRDITERKRAEERLKQSEQWLRTIFETSHEGILVEDNERIHYVNKSYARLFGYDDPEELIGQHISVVISPEDMDRLQEFGRSRLRGEQSPSEYEFKGKRKDGSTVDVEASVAASQVADSNYITTMIRDITERKRIEQALRESENKYRLLVEQASDGIHTYDTQGNFIETNSKLCEMLGYTPEELVRLNVKDLIPAEDLAVDPIRFDELRAGKTLLNERRLRCKDGSLLPVEISGRMIQDNVLQAIIRDITERKHAEILLDTQKRALEMVVGGSPLAEVLKYLAGIVERQSTGSSIASILLLDEQGRLHNGAAPSLPEDYVQAIDGIKADERVGTCSAAAATCKTIISPDIAADPKWQDLKHLPLGLGLQAAWSLPIMAADERVLGTFGTYFREKREPTKLEQQTVEILAKTAALAIERKKAEEALRESETRFRAAFEQANVGIVQASSEGRLLIVNPGFCKIIGYAEAEARGMMIRDITHRDDYEKEEELTRQLMAGETGGYSIEKRYLHKDSHLVWGQMTATLVRRASGEPYYMLAIVEDISERKRAEEALMKLNEQLEERVAERTVELMEMNASLQAEIIERRRAERERASILRRLVMAQEDERRRIARDMHDHFGQQLTVLILKLGMLKEDCGEHEKLCEQLESLEKVASQLDADVDFLVWELRPTILDDLGLQDALTNFAQNWSKHFGIPVEVLTHGLGKEPSTSEIDIVLYRIAQEALNNVAKHAGAASVTVLLEGRADAISLIIEDDGVGFDAENTSGANDKGLGLVGMRERAALVGGMVEVESHPEEGTRVIVRIPTPR